MEHERLTLLKTLAALVEGRFEVLEQVGAEKWQSLVALAHAEGMAPLLYCALQQAGHLALLPARAQLALRVAYAHTAAVNALLGRELVRVVRAVARLPQAPPLVVLKGAALIPLIYEDAGLRPLLDIDLLVHPDDLERVAGVLSELGYARLPHLDPQLLPAEHHLVFRRNQGETVLLTVELHWRLVEGEISDPTSPAGWFWSQVQLAELPLSAFTGSKGAQGAPSSTLTCHILSPTAHLLYLMAHLGVQHGPFSARLIWLYDIHRLVQRWGPRVDWPLLAEQAACFSWQETVGEVATVTHMLFGTLWPAPLEQLARPPSAVSLIEHGAAPTRLEGVWRRLHVLPQPMRLRYLFRQAVPTGEYMRWRYRPRPEWLWPLWYLYRWAVAFREGLRLAKGLWGVFLGRKKSKLRISKTNDGRRGLENQ